MARHVGTYFDEWKADPRGPRRSWPGSSRSSTRPGTPDPNISFSTERGQIRPETPAEPVVLGATIPVGAP